MTHLAYPEARNASVRPFGTGSPLLTEARALVRLAVPIMLIALVNMGMSVTDSLMVAHAFGAEGLAAVAVGSDFYSILFYLGAGIIAGLSPFYTAALTRADPGERARLERLGLLLVALCGIVLVPLVWTAPDWLSVLGVEAALLDAGRGYTRAMAFTLLAMLGVTLYRTVLTAAERPGVFLKVTLAMLPLNALGNAVFMHGLGPVPALGPTGAGISSLLVACTSLGLLVLISRRLVSRDEPARGLELGALAPVLRVGIPIGIATLGEVGVFLGATIYIAASGAADVAAHTLTLRAAGVAYALPVALLQAAMVRSARAEAKDDAVERRATTQAAIGLSLLSGVVMMGTLLVAAQALPATVFGGGSVAQEAAQLSVVLLTMLGVVELLAIPGSAIAGLLRGRKKARLLMLASLMGYWVVGAPLGLWLSEAEGLGVVGVWTGLVVGTAATTIVLFASVLSGRLRALEQGPPGGLPETAGMGSGILRLLRRQGYPNGLLGQPCRSPQPPIGSLRAYPCLAYPPLTV